MIRLIFLFLFVLVCNQSYAQNKFGSIDSTSKAIPDSIRTYRQIVNYLTRDLNSDEEKLRAVYVWITHNLDYDVSLLNSTLVYYSAEDIIEEAMSNRSGVCQHYAELFNAMCNSIGIPSFLISGYTLRDGNINNLAHAWNAVLLDSAFYLVDPTWGAGFVENKQFYRKFNDEFFLVEPEKFISTHIPFDPMWQFLEKPIKHYRRSDKTHDVETFDHHFFYIDSINQYHSSTDLQKLKSSQRRIRSAGVNNSLVDTKLSEISTEIAGLLFNRAVDTLNDGINFLNAYLGAKNTQFDGTKMEDTEVVELLEKAKVAIFEADLLLKDFKSTNPELNNLIRQANQKLSVLKLQISDETEFLRKYLKEDKSSRMLLFVK